METCKKCKKGMDIPKGQADLCYECCEKELRKERGKSKEERYK